MIYMKSFDFVQQLKSHQMMIYMKIHYNANIVETHLPIFQFFKKILFKTRTIKI